jgi:hypothetical protein
LNLAVTPAIGLKFFHQHDWTSSWRKNQARLDVAIRPSNLHLNTK